MNDNADSKKLLTIHLCGSFTKDSLVRQLAIRINTVFVCTTKTPTVQFEQDDCYVAIFYLDLNKIEEAAKTTSDSSFITKQPGTNVLILASENEREELGEGFLSLNAEATVKEIGPARKLHLTKEDTNTQNSCNVLSPVDVRRKLITIIRSVIPVQNEFVAASYTEDRYPDWLNLASFEHFKGTKIVVCSVDNERDHMALVWKPLIHLLNEQNSKHFAARTLILNKDHLSGATVFTADMVILCWNGSNRNVLDNYKKFLDALGKSMKTKPELKQSIIIHISGRPSSSKMAFDPETVSQLNIEGLLNPIAWHPVELSTITTDNEWLPDGPQHKFLTNILGEFPNKYDPFGGNYSAYVKQNNSINWKFSDTPDKQGAPCTIIVQPDKQRFEWKVKLEGAFPKMTSIAQMEPLQGSNNKWKITCTVRKPRTEKFPILDRVEKQVFFAEIEPRPETIFVLKFLQQRTKKGVVTAEKLVLSENVRPTETFNSIPPSSETPAPQEDPFV